MTWLLHFWYMLYEFSPEITNITRNLSGRPAHFILGCKFAQQKNTCWMGCGIISYQKACVIGHGIIAVKHAMQGRKTFPSSWMSRTQCRTTVTKPCCHMPQKYGLLLSYTTLFPSNPPSFLWWTLINLSCFCSDYPTRLSLCLRTKRAKFRVFIWVHNDSTWQKNVFWK